MLLLECQIYSQAPTHQSSLLGVGLGQQALWVWPTETPGTFHRDAEGKETHTRTRLTMASKVMCWEGHRLGTRYLPLHEGSRPAHSTHSYHLVLCTRVGMFGLAEGQHGPAFQGTAQPVKAKPSQPTKSAVLGPGKWKGSDTLGEAWQRKREGKLQTKLCLEE